ncbi:thiamine-monophosphate kinase [Natrinema pellirubrum DSM 15624]|uniref:Thiamine-monophosphate kinase n=1 Tax=Natrinema pellirubrum (strain DSM 15624 / CIP 106293 / JCM 10476 / NCIMB 786 / 157) TaxID=797303 RepID=L0JJ70_NATP1|nr:thiamine-phosphate kinase [Natrinema pellirubrum]AGB30376.1 thiamine-monophosphate kinase [Natrinema pellirubrum DSM 15624]ELY79397.1 thiamine-monophosphate kinase [Natrinema pellirubrum DSM 15624]
MDERAALRLLEGELAAAGDDAAVVDGLVVTTDMLHDRTDFPDGTTRYTAGWRAIGASLSDVAAMGAEATAAVAAYAAPTFERDELLAFVRGASEICDHVDAEYVGGDLDGHDEFTTATTAIGRADDPVRRSGARPGDHVCVTGTLGRSAAALKLFDRGHTERANELFRFRPRIAAGRALAPHASAMMDSSDGLARSLHQLAEASDCGFAIESAAVPIDDAVREVTDGDADALERATTFGEDFELVATVPEDSLSAVRSATDVPLSVLGTVRERDHGISMDGEQLADRGYTHG